jgi:hypothetical protein
MRARESCVRDQPLETADDQLRAQQAQTDASLVALANALEYLAEEVRANLPMGLIARERLSHIRVVTATVRQHHEAPTAEPGNEHRGSTTIRGSSSPHGEHDG